MKIAWMALCGLTACASAPPPALPNLALPARFVESGEWVALAPMDYQAPTQWWTVFNDAALNTLMTRAETGNPGLAIAAARHRVASELLAQSEAAQMPQVGIAGDALLGSASKRGVSVAATASWEIDLWGRAALGTAADRAEAAASLADGQAARMSLQALTVEAWYRLQAARQKQSLLQQSVQDQTQMLQRILARREAGVATGMEVASATEDLEVVKVRAERAGLSVSYARSALAELLGEPDLQPLASTLPALPSPPHTLPSTLLRQRPDITAAAQRVAAAHARHGLAKTAWYPRLALGAHAGLSKLTDSPLKIWSLGPGWALPLLDFGVRQADADQAQAEADAASAAYREVVLRAFRETEDALAAARWLDQAAQHQTAALAAATRSRELEAARFAAGTVSRLEWLAAQRIETEARIAALDLWRERLAARVALLKIQG